LGQVLRNETVDVIAADVDDIGLEIVYARGNLPGQRILTHEQACQFRLRAEFWNGSCQIVARELPVAQSHCLRLPLQNRVPPNLARLSVQDPGQIREGRIVPGYPARENGALAQIHRRPWQIHSSLDGIHGRISTHGREIRWNHARQLIAVEIQPQQATTVGQLRRNRSCEQVLRQLQPYEIL